MEQEVCTYYLQMQVRLREVKKNWTASLRYKTAVVSTDLTIMFCAFVSFILQIQTHTQTPFSQSSSVFAWEGAKKSTPVSTT